MPKADPLNWAELNFKAKETTQYICNGVLHTKEDNARGVLPLEK